MSITIEVTPELEAELVRQAAEQGVRVDAYAADLLRRAVQIPLASRPSGDILAAIDHLRRFGKTHGLSLDGMTIRELRHEARP